MAGAAAAGAAGGRGHSGAEQWRCGVAENGAGRAGRHLRRYAGGAARKVSVAHLSAGARACGHAVAIAAGQAAADLAPDATSGCPQGRAKPGPPPVGVKETWGGPAFP